MLKISRKVEYALVALRHFQSQDQDKLTSAKELANTYGVPQELLAKVLQRLARNNIIDAVKGPTGGYRLSKDPETIKMTEFFEIIEGPMGIMDCYFDSGCDKLDGCSIRRPISRINDSIRTMFDNMTLAEVTH
ncbi:MAG: Rrf2 family transcriptional regulator [Candidatus Marinimicrobia bacterium]|jgi:Rrf2 family protein|nr:Rrf2 family transcriptional regulator [Candidatus Neomarinimicrobiota bacterium]